MGQLKWPVLNKYFGLVNLKIGIYIKSVANLALIVEQIRLIAEVLEKVIYWGEYLREGHLPPDFEHLEEFDIDEALIEAIQRGMLISCIIQLTVKAIYVIVILCIMWAIFKQKAKMLKLFYIINIPVWIFDIILRIMFGAMDSYIFITLVYIFALFEAYNLLAIRSVYKHMTEKATPSLNGSISERQMVYPNGFTTSINRGLEITNETHCRTCTCNLTPMVQNVVLSSVQQSTQAIESPTQPEQNDPPPTYEAKELNFKEEPIIFNQSLLVERQSTVVDYDANLPQSSGSLAIAQKRPTNLNLTGTDIEKKVDISDIPVIYDENQLNVGSSPILEDK